MNKILKIMTIGFLSVLMISCLDEDPKYTTDTITVYNNQSSAQLALNGLYGLLSVQGSFAQLIPEINTETSGLCWSSFNPSDNRNQYTNGVIPIDNEFNNLVWGGMYQAIANCNIFIKSCSQSPNEWINKDNMIAQAKFLRGVAYYTLFSFYGGVPLRLEVSTKENIDIRRATRQEVIDQVIKDWTESIEHLNSQMVQGSGVPTAPTKYSAHAYLAKLYWLLGNYAWAAEQGDAWANKTLKPSWPEMGSSHSYFELAKKHGDEAILNGEFDLEPNFNTLYNGKRLNFSKEFVFVINTTRNTTENVGYNSLNWTYSPQNSTPGETWGRSQPNKSYYDWAHGTYQDDARLKATFKSKWYKYVNNKPTTEVVVSYPYVSKVFSDTTYKDSVLVPGLPPVPVQVITRRTRLIDSIEYTNPTKYEDPTNPQLDELDSLFKESYAKTKGPSSWNINDWPYFGKYMTDDVSGRYANNNLYIYRFADLLLLMADVENELGNTAKAVELANKVLERARNSSSPASVYPKAWTVTSQEDIREKIFHERLFELAAEFDMFNDTRRRGIAWRQKLLERNNNHHITRACYEYGVTNNYISAWREYWYPNDKKESWESYLTRNQLIPIPRSEFTSNSLMDPIKDQNPGY